MTPQQLISFLTQKILKLEADINGLKNENEKLNKELSEYKIKKNSGNSSMPPSSDMSKPKRNQSLRRKSGKKAGGQYGHPGKTLEWNENPDEFLEHVPNTCGQCGENLIDKRKQYVESRQVIDIPPIKVICTEHQIFSKRCSCGHINCGEFPASVQSIVQYGSNIEAMIAYLHTRQYIPYKRMHEFFECIMNLKISTGGLNHILQRFVKKCTPQYDAIKDRVEEAFSIGSDETGAVVNGDKGWFWTWQNKFFTYIVYSGTRGFITVENLFKDGLLNAIINHDCLAAQFKCKAKGHQACTSHLSRELIYLFALYDSKWAEKLNALINESIELKRELKASDYNENMPERNKLERRLTKLLKEEIPKKHEKIITFQNRLIKYRDSILLFLYHEDVPPDNNGSERAIRNIKVKQKVSGQFKSEKGARDFAVLRSIIDTAIKSGKEVFQELVNIANLAPE